MAISYLFSVITTYTTKIPLILFPIFTRQYSILLLEYPRKCLTSRKSIFFRNHTDRKIRIHQIIIRMPESQIVQIGFLTHLCIFPEHT